MKDFMQRKNTLINLTQIEGGLELLKKLHMLQELISEIDKDAYRLKSECIKAEDLDPQILENLYNTIMDAIIGEDGELSFDTLQDLHLQIKNLEMIIETCRKYNEPLTDIEREFILNAVLEDVQRIINTIITENNKIIDIKIEQSEEKLLGELDKLKNEMNNQMITVGSLENLHPFLKEAVDPNLSIVEVINFLFQLVLDKDSYGDLPKVFNLPSDYGQVANGVKEIEHLEDNSFGTVAERIRYRKNLGKISDMKDGE